METNSIDLKDLHNEEHFQFQTEFKDSVEEADAAKLEISDAFAIFLILYLEEKEALQFIRKSAITKQIEEADHDRDIIFRGLVDAVKSALKHFNADKKAAAKRLAILLDQYGNVARKPYEEESGSINKLVAEAAGTFAKDVLALNINDWFAELDARNKAFINLTKGRDVESSDKTDLRMKQVRIKVDDAYRAITKRLNAMMLLNGTAKYEAFVRELNVRVDRYNTIIAQRKGRGDKGNGGTNNPTK